MVYVKLSIQISTYSLNYKMVLIRKSHERAKTYGDFDQTALRFLSKFTTMVGRKQGVPYWISISKIAFLNKLNVIRKIIYNASMLCL